jgi:hypothetical protein
MIRSDRILRLVLTIPVSSNADTPTYSRSKLLLRWINLIYNPDSRRGARIIIQILIQRY